MVRRKEHDAALSDLEEARRSLDRLNQSFIEMAPREQLTAARKETKAWQDKGAALREELQKLAVKSEDLRVQVAYCMLSFSKNLCLCTDLCTQSGGHIL